MKVEELFVIIHGHFGETMFPICLQSKHNGQYFIPYELIGFFSPYCSFVSILLSKIQSDHSTSAMSFIHSCYIHYFEQRRHHNHPLVLANVELLTTPPSWQCRTFLWLHLLVKHKKWLNKMPATRLLLVSVAVATSWCSYTRLRETQC